MQAILINLQEEYRKHAAAPHRLKHSSTTTYSAEKLRPLAPSANLASAAADH